MSTPRPQRDRPLLTRRRALAGAAWSAPAIVLVSTAPAFAASTPTDSALTLTRGAAATPSSDGTDDFFDLVFENTSILVPDAGLAAGTLQLTATFAPTSPLTATGLFVVEAPTGWAISPDAGDVADTVVMVYAPATGANAEVQFPDGDFFGTASPAADEQGSFVLVASAPGYGSSTQVYATGAGRAARGSARLPTPRRP